MTSRPRSTAFVRPVLVPHARHRDPAAPRPAPRPLRQRRRAVPTRSGCQSGCQASGGRRGGEVLLSESTAMTSARARRLPAARIARPQPGPVSSKRAGPSVRPTVTSTVQPPTSISGNPRICSPACRSLAVHVKRDVGSAGRQRRCYVCAPNGTYTGDPAPGRITRGNLSPGGARTRRIPWSRRVSLDSRRRPAHTWVRCRSAQSGGP